MAVVAAFLYRHGQRVREVAINERVQCAADKSEFVWIGIADPTEAEMQALSATYDLHPLAVEDALKANQLPKVDIYGTEIFVVARTAHLDQGAIAYGETALFVGPTHIVSVRHGSPRSHGQLRAQLEAVPTRLAQGVDYVLHAILDYIVDGYLPTIEAIEDEVLAMEQRSIDHFLTRDEITRIFALRRELIRFRRVLTPMMEVSGKLARNNVPCIDEDARPYFNDVLDHVHRVVNMVDDLRESMGAVFEFSNVIEQQRTGVITRQLAAWAAILAVPTAIAGIYGMNFEHMPELKLEWGYPVVIGVIVAACSFLYWRFKRTGWL